MRSSKERLLKSLPGDIGRVLTAAVLGTVLTACEVKPIASMEPSPTIPTSIPTPEPTIISFPKPTETAEPSPTLMNTPIPTEESAPPTATSRPSTPTLAELPPTATAEPLPPTPEPPTPVPAEPTAVPPTRAPEAPPAGNYYGFRYAGMVGTCTNDTIAGIHFNTTMYEPGTRAYGGPIGMWLQQNGYPMPDSGRPRYVPYELTTVGAFGTVVSAGAKVFAIADNLQGPRDLEFEVDAGILNRVSADSLINLARNPDGAIVLVRIALTNGPEACHE